MPPPPRRAGSSPASPRTAFTLLALVIVLWGVNWPVMKLGLRDIGPLSFASLRMVLGAGCMFAVVAARRQLRLPPRADLPVVASVGLLQTGLFLLLVNLALLYVPAGRSAILAYTTPLWVVPGAILFLGERLSGPRLIGFLLGMMGVAVLFNPLGFDWSDPDVVLGNSLLMLGALAWAATILQVRKHRWHATPLDLAPWQFSVAAAMLVPLAFLFERDRPIAWTGQLVAVIVYNGPLATAFCFWAVVTVNRALPAITTSLAMLGVPIAGALCSALWLGEPLTPTNVGGLILITGGLAVLARADRQA